MRTLFRNRKIFIILKETRRMILSIMGGDLGILGVGSPKF